MKRYHLVLIAVIVGAIFVGLFLCAFLAWNGAFQGETRNSFGGLFGFPSAQYSTQTLPERRTLDSFPEAKDTWRARFVSSGDGIPEGKFQPYYFDTTNPAVRFKAAPVDSIALNIGWGIDSKTGKDTDYISAPGTISSENLGAYWIGTFVLPEEKDMDLAISLSWSEARVIIDGREVFKEGNNNASVPLRLTSGKHTMEVEYVNNWHTVSFMANLMDSVQKLSDAELKAALPKSGVANYWYAGVYESDARNGEIALSAPGIRNEPTILFLSSYDPVQWNISALSGLDIRAIVVSSFSPGAQVLHAREGMPVYYADLPYAYETKGNCTVAGGMYHCENLNDFSSLYNRVRDLTGGKPLNAFLGSYSASTLEFPGLILTKSVVDELLAYPAEKEREAQNFEQGSTLDGVFQ